MSPAVAIARPLSPSAAVAPEERLGALVSEHYAFVWRVLRRLGLAPADADDAAQRVFLTVRPRVADIELGRERAFLFRVATHVASKAHRSRQRRPDVAEGDCDEHVAATPGMEELLEQRRARALLDDILAELPDDLRAVLILFELEELTTSEVGAALGIPAPTVASRLRRARELVQERLIRRQARARAQGVRS